MKTRYFTQTKKDEIAKNYLIPTTTLTGWEKKRTVSSDWRGLLFDKLSLFTEIEKATLVKLKQIFNKKELQAIWGCLKSTMITSDLIFMKEALGYGFVDYCNYESMEASQFTDDLEKFSKIVSEKLNSLTEFEKYALLEYITSKESQGELFQNT